MRGIILAVLAILPVAMGAMPAFGAVSAPCPGSIPVSTFKLMVEPPKGGVALPVNSINAIEPGDKLIYEPAHPARKRKGKAKVAILLAPASGDASAHIEVLAVKPADAPAEWKVPMHASVVGLVFGPQGLDVHKINSLVKKHPDLVLKLTDYVEQTSKVEALVQTLSKYEQSAPGSTNLQSMLSHFSSQFGVALPQLSAGMPSDQQAVQLLHAVLPAFSTSDPLTRPTITQQSTGLAASVATFFFGPQVIVAAGGANLLEELHAAFFPHAEFRSAFAEPVASKGMDLCTSRPKSPSKTRARIAYLWMLHIPDAEAPSVSLPKPVDIPAGWISTVNVSCASISQLRLLPRARDWHLVSAATNVAIPVKVNVGPEADSLVLDLTHTKLPAGQYHLVAQWDWSPVKVAGAVNLLNFADYSTVKISSDSEDHLVTGSGSVPVDLTGADFEFLDNMTLVDAKHLRAAPTSLSFSLPGTSHAGPSQRMTANINASKLPPGAYFLRLSQLNGQTHDVPVIVHPPNPSLDHLPVRVNLGQPQQTIELRGTNLDRIVKIKSEDVSWTLDPASAESSGARERQAILKLSPKAKKGARISAKVFVAGIQEPLEVADVLEVTGPRPTIVSVRKSFAGETGVELRSGEIPAQSAVSFAIDAQNADSRSILRLQCGSTDDTKRALTLTQGERDGANELDFAGAGALFLSLDPGDVGHSGCLLMATLTSHATGASDPFALGRIIRLPQIDQFTLSDESIGKSLYAGVLTGKDLQAIAMTGWNAKNGTPVQGIPTPVPGETEQQTLKIAMPWPPPAPHARLYIWLSGETEGRATNARYE